MRNDSEKPSYTELNPLPAMRPQLVRKGHFVPAVIACIGFIGLLLSAGLLHPDNVGNTQAWQTAQAAPAKVAFWTLVAIFISAVVMGLIYVLCGKRKPWWVLAGTVVGTAFLLLLQDLLGSPVAALNRDLGIIGPGLVEELFKAIPVFCLYWYAKSSKAANSKEVGVTEPLDGILIGAAAAIGFSLVETLFLYAPRFGWELVVPRLLGNLFGHAAYSAYLGYFIGLAALRPERPLRTISIGLAFSFAMHNAWDFLPSRLPGLFGYAVELAVGIVTYAGLAAAILKARQISPNRRANFATQFVSHSQPIRKPPVVARIALVGLSGPVAGKRFSMSSECVKVGRDPSECQIVLADGAGKISRVHCSVRMDASGQRLWLEDHHSTNGTFIGNGERLSPGQRTALAPNATFYLSGPSVMFQVVSE